MNLKLQFLIDSTLMFTQIMRDLDYTNKKASPQRRY